MSTIGRPRSRRVGLALLVGNLSVACASNGRVAPQPFPLGPSGPTSTQPGGTLKSPAPSASPPSSLREPDALVQTAVGLRGIPYRLGGDDPGSGFDCSGLVMFVFEQHNMPVARTVAEQYLEGRRVSIDNVQAGDLIFFSTVGPGATHVGIALGTAGPGEFVHAPGEGGSVRIERYDTPYWRSRIVGVKRLF